MRTPLVPSSLCHVSPDDRLSWRPVSARSLNLHDTKQFLAFVCTTLLLIFHVLIEGKNYHFSLLMLFFFGPLRWGCDILEAVTDLEPLSGACFEDAVWSWHGNVAAPSFWNIAFHSLEWCWLLVTSWHFPRKEGATLNVELRFNALTTNGDRAYAKGQNS